MNTCVKKYWTKKKNMMVGKISVQNFFQVSQIKKNGISSIGVNMTLLCRCPVEC